GQNGGGGERQSHQRSRYEDRNARDSSATATPRREPEAEDSSFLVETPEDRVRAAPAAPMMPEMPKLAETAEATPVKKPRAPRAPRKPREKPSTEATEASPPKDDNPADAAE
ncbi:MAG: hypothetical protein WBH14_07550, partial [Albidovulum sp.]